MTSHNLLVKENMLQYDMMQALQAFKVLNMSSYDDIMLFGKVFRQLAEHYNRMPTVPEVVQVIVLAKMEERNDV